MAQPGPSDYRTVVEGPTREQTQGAQDWANGYGERAQTLTEDLAGAVKERPFTTLAVAAGLAFAVGALWKISHRRPRTRLEAFRSQLPDVRDHVRDLPSWEGLRRRWRNLT